MLVNSSYVDQTNLLESWRISNAYEVTRYKRMLWASKHYAKAHDIPSIRAYKALDSILDWRSK